MLDTIASFFGQEHEFDYISQLTGINFDCNVQKQKECQKFLSHSCLVEDLKGNPGRKGKLTLTNLRVLWECIGDPSINISIGLETINSIVSQKRPVKGGSVLIQLCIIKAQRLNQTRTLEFKFVGHGSEEQKLFKLIEKVVNMCLTTKKYRCVSNDLGMQGNELLTLRGEELKSCEKGKLLENKVCYEVTLMLTNIRLILFKSKSNSLSYSIPWIMIQSYSKIESDNKKGIRINARGKLKDKQLQFFCSPIKKLMLQIKSYCQTANNAPILGYEEATQVVQVPPPQPEKLIEQIQESKVNVKRMKDVYSSEKREGDLQDTEFNEQLGIMMEKLPWNITRANLWEIIKL